MERRQQGCSTARVVPADMLLVCMVKSRKSKQSTAIHRQLHVENGASCCWTDEAVRQVDWKGGMILAVCIQAIPDKDGMARR